MHEFFAGRVMLHVTAEERDGFVINPYDPCVANKQVGASQMTVCWHVDDLKVSHADAAEQTRFELLSPGPS